ncbi:acyltransferase family protein [Nostoc sp.]|uniref:acyltransferase family protein n=1 Tax=Nostoc sp. TaxID=1180 RepID=UPI002FF8F09A
MIIERNRIFDGIRGFAFLIVLLMHGLSICYDRAYPYLQGCGKYGVWLFFVLSAFLLTRNYILGEGRKAEYIIARIFKIIPLYLLCIFCYTLVGIIAPTRNDWAYILMAQYGPIHLWTIPVEFDFYALLFFLWIIPNRRVRNAIFLVAVVGSVLALIYGTKNPNSSNSLWYLSSFYIGYILAQIWDNLPRVSNGILMTSITLSVFVFLSPGIQYLVMDIEPSPYLMNMYLPLSFTWAIFIVSVCKSNPNIINKLLSSDFFVLLGNISYSGYLFHFLIMVKSKQYLGSGIASVIISIILSIITAYVLSRLIELPIYRLRKIFVLKIKNAQQGGVPKLGKLKH